VFGGKKEICKKNRGKGGISKNNKRHLGSQEPFYPWVPAMFRGANVLSRLAMEGNAFLEFPILEFSVMADRYVDRRRCVDAKAVHRLEDRLL
jgi:hypothetical protein